MPASQPLDPHAPVHDPDLVGAWLGKTVAHLTLGTDASPAGDDLTPIGKPTNLPVGVHLVAASLQYLRRAEAAWRPDSFGVVSAWIKLDSVGVIHRIFTSADEAGDNDYWAFSVDAADHLCVEANIGGVSRGVAGDSTLVADRWYRVSAMTDGGTWALYVDADRETVTPAGAGNDGSWLSDVPDRDNVCIGALRTNAILEYFDGSIKDVRYRELTVDVPDDVTREFRQAVPDSSLAFWTIGGMTDLTRYQLPITLWNDVVAGHEMSFAGGVFGQSLETTAVELLTGAATSFWFNARADEEAVLFNNVAHLNRRLVVKTYAGGELRAGYWQGAVYRAAQGTGYQINRWHHIYCSTDTDDTCRLWLDGTELTGDVDPSSGNGINLRLGASSSGSGNFNGRIRDCRVWQADKGEAFGQTLYEMQKKYY